MIDGFRELLRNEEFRAHAKKLKVQGHVPGETRLSTFDLLNDDIVASAQMIKVNRRGKAINSAHAYAQIVQAYHDLRYDIDQAVDLLDAEQ